MKSALLLLVGAVAALAMAGLWHGRYRARVATQRAAEIARLQQNWDAERSELEASLERARRQASATLTPPAKASAVADQSPTNRSPAEILAEYRALRITPGAPAAPVLRQAVYLLEELARTGTSGVPAIREFLSRYEDADLDTSLFQGGKGLRDRIPLEFALPPSLRFGIFETVRRLGGAEAEALFLESLARTGRGAEVAYLALALEEIAPNGHRDQILATARSLLARTSTPNLPSPIDRNHRDFLFAVLSWFNDSGYAREAQAQLVTADSQLDRGALRYLQQTLGAQAVPIAAQAYQNPLLTNSAGKEPLARLALTYVGADSTANEFYTRAINDPLLTRSHRKNLIEDLNQDGFVNTRNLTEADLPLIQNRIQLIESLAPGAMDDANAAAFQEAMKDLLNMRAKILEPPPSPAAR